MWEYEFFEVDKSVAFTEVMENMNRLGENGWELASTIDAGKSLRFIFKKAK